MINRTNIIIPKKYEKCIDEIFKDSDGYWCYLSLGYTNPDEPYGGLHSIHEDSQKELLSKIRNNEECQCEECKKLKEQNEREEER